MVGYSNISAFSHAGFMPRFYRSEHAGDLVELRVTEEQTDLAILVDAVSEELRTRIAGTVHSSREDLTAFIRDCPLFGTSFEPVVVPSDAPAIVTAMARAAAACGVGPMAAVAGAVAQCVAEACLFECHEQHELEHSVCREVIVENGGDLYLHSCRNRVVALWTGQTGVDGVGVEVAAEQMPLAVATSSGRFGHSVSLGGADAVCVLSSDGALADAAATAGANRIHTAQDIEPTLKFLSEIEGVVGAVATIDGALGAWGQVKLVPTNAFRG